MESLFIMHNYVLVYKSQCQKMTLMSGFMVQGHIYHRNMMVILDKYNGVRSFRTCITIVNKAIALFKAHLNIIFECVNE